MTTWIALGVINVCSVVSIVFSIRSIRRNRVIIKQLRMMNRAYEIRVLTIKGRKP